GAGDQLRIDAIDAVERIRKLLAEEINRRLIAFRRSAQVLRIDRIELVLHRQVTAPIADVRRVDQELSREQLFDADRPTLRVRLLALKRIHGEGLAQVRRKAAGRSKGRLKTVRKWIGRGSDVGQAVVQ